MIAVVMGDLSLVRCLGRHGIEVVLAGAGDLTSVGRSRYVRRRLALPGLGEPARDAENVDRLVRLAAALARPVALFYQGDDDLLFVSRNREALAGRYAFVVPDAELVEATVDKARFVALARRARLPVPRTVVIRRGAARLPAAAQRLRFPLIAKPSHRHGWFGSSLQREHLGSNQKAIGVASAAELARLFPLLSRHGTEFILQECVTGGEARIVSYHAYVRGDGRLVAEFTGRKVRTYPCVYGLSTAVEITDDAEVRDAGRDVLRRLDFQGGVVKLDFKRDARSEALRLLEVNPRFTLWNHPGALAGVDIPKAVYDDLRGVPSMPRLVATPGVRWMSARADLKAYLDEGRGVWSLKDWVWELVTADVREDLSFSDPWPSLADLVGSAGRSLSRLRPRGAAGAAAK